MAITTTHGPKPFSWSYSKLKNYEVCPKRHWHVDLAKDFKEEEGESLRYGNQLHSAVANRIGKGNPLPKEFEFLEGWCQRMLAGVGETVEVKVEQKLAITKDFGPCDWFGNGAWFRAVIDVLKIVGSVALVADWKTGKILEDSVQLALNAACVFAHFPQVQKIRSEFIWLKEGDATSREDFNRNDMVTLWRNIWPRIEALKQAHETTTYTATPNRLCAKWCPVTSCPYHGRRS